MAHRIEISSKNNLRDTRADALLSRLKHDFSGLEDVLVVDVYTISKDFENQQLEQIASSLTNPVIQNYSIDQPAYSDSFDFAVEIGYLPGVTDNTGATAKEIIEDLLKTTFSSEEDVYSSRLILFKGTLNSADVDSIAQGLANELIQRVQVKSLSEYQANGGMGIVIPRVQLVQIDTVDEVDLSVSEDELMRIAKEGIANADGTRRGPLALSMPAIKAIKSYFESEGRNPTDIELETIAQTWSEHCKHTIFASAIDDVEDGLYKHYIKRATKDIRAAKGADDFCVSVFKDNSGGIIFDSEWLITDKAETHNSPSALDPFGGAITGIVGVNRDTIGFGKGAMPVINKYGYCFADPFDKEPIYRDKELTNKMLSPRRILDGVVAGVNAGGNCSGIPTPQGFVYFHERYKGKPLIFVGTVGLIPREINGKSGAEKCAQKGDKIVMLGGKVGADGIHGATFSSESLNSGSPATAVQIGDPYTQKKLSDAVVKEARGLGLYNSITDNGAGGLSSSIGEMAEQSGGCRVELDKVPLKYPGLAPWQIWISESQERMSLAVPPQKIDEFMALMKRRGVGAWVIGEFTDSGRCVVEFNGEKIMDMALEFMHEGNPKLALHTDWQKPDVKEAVLPPEEQMAGDFHNNTLKGMLSALNNAGFSFISYQYDYEVLAGSCVKPLQGVGQVNGTASVTRPILNSRRGVVCSQALYPLYSEIDSYNMAGASIDTAVRQCLAVGGSLKKLALMDNFCWCSSDEPERLGQLKEAARGCYDFAVAYGTPYISGKDSMFNDFKGYDAKGNAIKISVPPTLLISATGVVEDSEKCITLDFKAEGDLIYVLGETKNELGGSEYLNNFLKQEGGGVPHVDAKSNLGLYNKFEQSVADGLVESAFAPAIGGLAMALAKSAIAGHLGAYVDLSLLPSAGDVIRDDVALYSESQGRFVVTVAPENKERFEALMSGQSMAMIGKVTGDELLVKGLQGTVIVKQSLADLIESYKGTFKDF